MVNRGDRGDRGVSTLIGFVLLFGILITSFAIYQGLVVPEQNKQAEFDHSQKIQGQMLDLQEAIRRTGTTGVSQSVSIQVGVDYPERTLGVNFATGSGQVRTERANPPGSNNITFENVSAVRGEVADYWDSSSTALGFRTKDIVYDPQYTRYSDAPDTVYSNTGVFNQFDGANLSIADQILIQGNRITVVAINGTYARSKSGDGASVSISTEPLSVATNSIAIENRSGRINITVPTTVASRSAWLNETSLGEQSSVRNVTRSGSNVSITLKNGTYSLRMAKVGVGSRTVEEGAEYVVPVNPPPRTVSSDTSHDVTVEVRDRFNNPVSGTEVNATVDGPGSIKPENGDNTTDSNGQVTFNYTAPSNGGSATLVFNISGGPAGSAYEREIVNHTVSIVGGSVGSSDPYSQLDMVVSPPQEMAKEERYATELRVLNESDFPDLSGKTITASATNVAGGTETGSFLDPNNQKTTSPTDGTVNFTYEAPNATTEIKLTFNVNDGTPNTEREQLTFVVNVTEDGISGSDTVNEDSGSGGNEKYSDDNKETSVSQPGGTFEGITGAQNIYISNPKFQSVKPNDGGVSTGKEYFRMVFVLERNVSGQPTGTTRYMFVLPSDKQGITQKTDDSSIQFDKRKITIYKDASTNNDGTGWTKLVDQAQIQQNDLKDWYTGSGPNGGRINLLDGGFYSENYNTEFNEIQTFMQNNEVNLYFVDMYGKVDLRAD